jgi:nicotinamidase-related amidase
VEALAPKPVNALLMGPSMRIGDLARAGVRRVSTGGALARVAMAAAEKAAHALLDEEAAISTGVFRNEKALTPPVELHTNTCLLIIDIQQGFDDPQWRERNNPEAEGNVGKLLGRWRQAGMPVVHVQHDSVLANSPLRSGSPGNALKPIAAPLANEVVHRKTVNSAFIGTNLESDLRGREIQSLVVVGLTTNHCVSTTVRMAGNLGFRAYVVADATAAFARPDLYGRMRSAAEVHAAALGDLRDEFATIVDTAQVLTAISGKCA